MATSKCSKVNRKRGFTMVEVLIAIIILTVGLVSLAALLSRMDFNTGQSRYSATASLLASEKLEHLNRLASIDPALAAGGDLTTDMAGYSDQVAVSVSDGTFQETFTGDLDFNGVATNTTYVQGPDGTFHKYDTPPASSAPVFKRRWLIEKSPTGLPGGVKRVTVLVTAPGNGNGKAATFQMSMVRYD